jgi:pimeloyl-ACP methyl ester carboxylesterase
MARKMQWEWEEVASAMIADGRRSCNVFILPNLHSNDSTKPQALKNGDTFVRAFLKASLEQVLGNADAKVILMGKSWGGGIAGGFASRVHDTSSFVKRLVLVAPASLHDLSRVNVPTLLLWAHDDPVVQFSRARQIQATCAPQCKLYSEPSGGHRVLHAYTEVIVSWLAQDPL